MPRRPGYNSRATQFILSFNSALTYDFILMGLYYFPFYFFFNLQYFYWHTIETTCNCSITNSIADILRCCSRCSNIKYKKKKLKSTSENDVEKYLYTKVNRSRQTFLFHDSFTIKMIFPCIPWG